MSWKEGDVERGDTSFGKLDLKRVETLFGASKKRLG